MAATVAIGIQKFAQLREKRCFYVDKTDFIRDWWESNDSVTLLTRPRRFGKTLNMSMLESFFSVDYANRGDFETTSYRICELLRLLYEKNAFLRDSSCLSDMEKDDFDRLRMKMGEVDAPMALYHLSDYLSRYYGKKVIIILDEYDTPMQELCHVSMGNVTCSSSPFAEGKSSMGCEFPVDGYWDELVAFTRSLFNSTFKTNPYLERE